MKRLIYILIVLTTMIALNTRCNKDPELSVLRTVTFNSAASADVSSVILLEDNAGSDAVTIQWEAVDYFIGAPVTYYLQFTPLTDTSLWAKYTEIEVGVDLLSVTISVEELNDVAKKLQLEPGVINEIAIRVKSYVDRYAYSQPVVLDVTSYEVYSGFPSLWVAGDFQGWNPASAPRISSPKDDELYEGYIFIPPGGTNQFKFTAQPDWEPTAYGDGGSGNLIVSNASGDNFTAPSDGYFNLTANLTTMKYTITKTSWSIIGDATAGGWTTDTPMTYDEASQVWVVNADMTTAGSFKFRANNAWVIDFGIDADGVMKYADHNVFPYTPGLLNLTVPEDGNYIIILDLHDAGNYSYSLNKQ